MKDFLAYHNISSSNWDEAEACIEILSKARESILDTQEKIISSESLLKKNLSMPIIQHLTDRIYSYIRAAMSCILTTNAESSEIITRTAIESCINIRYFLSNDPESLILIWLKKDLENKKGDIDNWEKYINDNIKNDIKTLELHQRTLEKRKAHHHFKTQIVDDLINDVQQYININLNSHLPRKINKRFENLGEDLLYHNVYTRLSSQSHMTAEDTIDYIYHTTCSGEITKQAWQNELLSFSKFMLYISIYEYIKVAQKFSAHYLNDSQKTVARLGKYINDMYTIIESISEKNNWN